MSGKSLMEQARDAARDFVKRAELQSYQSAVLGRRKNATTVVFDVPGRKRRKYITFPDGTFTEAICEIDVPNQAFLPLKVRLEHNTYVIKAIDGRAEEAFANLPSNPYGTTPHPFTSHTDVPDSYAGAAGKVVRVNEEGCGLVFDDLTTDDVAEGSTNKYLTAGNMAATVDAADEQATPTITDRFALVVSGVLKWMSYASLRDFIKSYYDSVVGTLTNKSIDGLDNTITNIDTSALANDAVSNSKLANMAANTIKANVTGSTADPSDVDAATLLAQYIHGATSKATPVDADELGLIDSAASNVLKRLTLANLKATLKPYLDTLYVALAGNQTVAGNKTFSGQTTFSGQVGVGPTSPSEKLEVSANGAANGVKSSTSSAHGAFFEASANNDTVRVRLQAGTTQGFFGTLTNHPLRMYVNNVLRAAFSEDGDFGVGIDTETPMGRVHVRNGTAGSMAFVTKTGIVGSAQTIIPDGTGDVSGCVHITGVATNIIAQRMKVDVFLTNNSNADVTTDGGTNSIRFAVSSAGALTVVRQAGSSTWQVAVLCVWR